MPFRFLLLALATSLAAAATYDPTVLPKAHEYFNLRDGLHNSRVKFEQEKTGRVVFLGGSITHGGGWRDETMRTLQKRFPETKFSFIAAGIPSLGSLPHAFRLERDVLAQGPVDLLFVEAAVNDTCNSTPPLQMLRAMEGLVRHMRTVNPLTDIVHLHFVMPEHMRDFNQGKTPDSVAQHEKVAVHYTNPSLNLSLEVTERINAKEFTWAGDFKDLHPSPFGQKLYSNSIARMLNAAYNPQTPATAKPHALLAPLDPQNYARGRFGALDKAKLIKGFKLVPEWTPVIPRGTRPGYVKVPALAASEAQSEFEFDFEGTGAGLMLGAGPDTGILEVSTDGGAFKKIDTFTQWSQGLYLPWAIMLEDGLKEGPHKCVVRISAEKNAKSAGNALYVFSLLLN